MSINDIRQTIDNKLLGVIRIVTGLIFLITGFLQLFIPKFTEAWLGQLIHAGIPLVTLNFFFVPFVEIVLGLLLLKGLFTRFFSLLIFPIMFVAIYVHIFVKDASLFPLQPKLPILPIILLIKAIILLRYGAGSWSDDLRWSKKNPTT
ncbi:MAG: DoxX family protein [Ignavibacteriaceae bacterium]